MAAAVNTYYIPTHVYFAFEGDAVVFLNLRADQYSMLIGPKAALFKNLVFGPNGLFQRTFICELPRAEDDPTLIRELITELLESRLATITPIEPAYAPSAAISLPEESLLDPQPEHLPRLRPRDVTRFFISCTIALFRLRFTPIEATVRAIERRRLLAEGSAKFDMSDARRLVRIYNRLRPFVAGESMCLFDSLSLIEFLAAYSIFPKWVFAVRSDPWMAHCWVQFEAVAFNQHPDEARTYLPIMAI